MTYCLTCDYNACEDIKIKDLFSGLNVSDTTCQSKIARINRILRSFYLDTIDFEQNRVNQEVVCDDLSTITTEFPIYKVRGFYAHVTEYNSCVENYCITNSTEDEVCRHCESNPEHTYLLKTFLTKNPIKPGQYNVACDNKIVFKKYDCFNEIYLEYSRGPKIVNSLEDSIQIDTKMLIALEYYIEWHYALRNKELNMLNKYAELYTDTLRKLKDSESYIPYSIGSSNSRGVTHL